MSDHLQYPPRDQYKSPRKADFCVLYYDVLDSIRAENFKIVERNYDDPYRDFLPIYTSPEGLLGKLALKARDAALTHARRSRSFTSAEEAEMTQFLLENMTVHLWYTWILNGEERQESLHYENIYDNYDSRLAPFLYDFATVRGGQRLINCYLEDEKRQELLMMLR